MQAVDVLFEVRDARLPVSSTHPKIEELFGNKARVIVFCKEDLADPNLLAKYIARFRNKGIPGIGLSLKAAKGKDRLIQLAMVLCQDKLEARKKKGLLDRPLRVAVVGLPNVGKSSLINWIAGKRKAHVANTPGVTRGNSWIRIHPQVELLDTPGILPVTAFKGDLILKLGLCNILPSDQYDMDDVAQWAIQYLSDHYSNYLDVYKTEGGTEPVDIEQIAAARHCLKAGGVPDLQRAAAIFLSELRAAKLGRAVFDYEESPEAAAKREAEQVNAE